MNLYQESKKIFNNRYQSLPPPQKKTQSPNKTKGNLRRPGESPDASNEEILQDKQSNLSTTQVDAKGGNSKGGKGSSVSADVASVASGGSEPSSRGGDRGAIGRGRTVSTGSVSPANSVKSLKEREKDALKKEKELKVRRNLKD
jgi:hypothetical protein